MKTTTRSWVGAAVSPGRVVGETVRSQRASLTPATSFTEATARLRERLAVLEKSAWTETLELFLNDPMVAEEIEKERLAGKELADALINVRDRMAEPLLKSSEPYLRERATDIRDFFGALLEEVTGDKEVLPNVAGKIYVAESLSLLVVLKALEEGAIGVIGKGIQATSHVAIVLRSSGVPAISMERSDEIHGVVGIDGDAGVVVHNPPASFCGEGKGAPTVANVRGDVTFWVNSFSLRSPLPAWATGVGLLRTEMLCLQKGRGLSVDEYVEVFTRQGELCGKRPLTVRLLDVGADKGGLFSLPKEMNPALGVRGIRLRERLETEEEFANQLNAVEQLAGKFSIRVLVPMVTKVEEVHWVRQQLSDKVPVGAMVETPAAIEILELLHTVSDFYSVGSNDLLQYVMAADRTNDDVSQFLEPLAPAFVRTLARAVGQRGERPMSVCGEMAGTPLGARLCVALGFTSLSFSPACFSAVQGAMGGELPTREALLQARSATEVSALLEN